MTVKGLFTTLVGREARFITVVPQGGQNEVLWPVLTRFVVYGAEAPLRRSFAGFRDSGYDRSVA